MVGRDVAIAVVLALVTLALGVLMLVKVAVPEVTNVRPYVTQPTGVTP